MKIKASPLLVLSIAIFLPLIIACGTTAPTAPNADQTTAPAAPVPTPVPAQDRAVAVDFLKQQNSLATQWEDLHTDFDQWQTGLVSCDRSSIVTALRGFSGDFS
ncbi:MAG: hypothetical protein ACE5Q6_03560, partial [Dehalococcoidia bacterium]